MIFYATLFYSFSWIIIGLDIEGMFRISAGASLIAKYKNDFDMCKFIRLQQRTNIPFTHVSDPALLSKYFVSYTLLLALDVDLSKCPDPHAVSGLLKLYLRELPEPLLTYELYDSFLGCNGCTQDDEKIKQLHTLWTKLPMHSQSVLALLLPFLKRVINHSDTNLMTVSNIATVFAPTLLKPRSDDAALLVQQNSSACAVVEFILTHQDSIFPQNSHSKPIHIAIALYSYSGSSARELSFTKGDEMQIFQKLESGWLLGTHDGQNGLIPATYVKLLPPDQKGNPTFSCILLWTLSLSLSALPAATLTVSMTSGYETN